MINEERFRIFADLYRAKLAEAVRDFPGDYTWGKTATVDSVADRMLATIKTEGIRRVNKDGRAFKATCRTLGIAHTYKAIDAYLAGGTT
jgi:hypothetical protein